MYYLAKKSIQFSIVLSLLSLIACSNGDGSTEYFVPSKDVIGYQHNYYNKHEIIKYVAHYGLVKAGAITIQVDTALHAINKKICYKTTFEGKAIGSINWFNNINDVFTSFVDTSTKLPVLFIRNIRENKFKKVEKSSFYHDQLKVVVHELKTNKPDSIKEFAISNKMEDMISAYFLLRNVDFSNIKVNDSLSMDVFLENKSYNFKFKYLRKEKLKTKVGIFNSIVLAPIMPSNDFLRTENPIQAWLSDDDRRIPLKVKAKLLAGAVEMDITSYQTRR